MPGTKIVQAPGQAMVKQHARAIRMLLERTAANIVEIGRRLTEVRDVLPNNAHWRLWLKREFGWGDSHAGNFIRVAARFGGTTLPNRFQPSALMLLANSHVPDEAVQEAMAAARKGTLVTHTAATQIIRKHRPESVPQADQTLLWNLKRRVQRLAEQLGCNFMAEQLQTIVNELRERGAESGPMSRVSTGVGRATTAAVES